MAKHHRDKRSPTPAGTVRHFLATVEDYKDFSALFELPNHFTMGAQRQDDRERWTVIMHALLLRKYFAEDDPVNLTEVMKSARQCQTGHSDYPPEDWDALETNAMALRDFAEYHIQGNVPVSESEVLRRELYGRYLHGDWGKWEHTRRIPANLSEHAVWEATVNRHQRVRKVEQFLRLGIEEGALAVAEQA